MFCYQCEQTSRTEISAGCSTTKGVCGKDEATADLQDLLVHLLKGIGQYSTRLHAAGKPDAAADHFILFGLFTTLTNVNFNRARFVELIAEAAAIRDRLRAAYEEIAPGAAALGGPAAFQPAADLAGLLKQANPASVRAGIELVGEDVVGLRSLVLYGLKGVAAYAHHADVLGQSSEEVGAGVAHALDLLAADPTDIGVLLNEAIALGNLNFKVMGMLDAANTGTFGTPTPPASKSPPSPARPSSSPATTSATSTPSSKR